ncbi:hypothetical protein [Kushneria konosiri]|uniref:Uncharacterized protein n=1 Tax=Kushneria konosiri TaxID=698828 RepID=A0A2Z2H8B3_9GAMM|nr:hypothetical protein [Kushneria konosiri]ARS53689.1 hypothetical protein B9G99_13170 [Kushneria konosiri]
MIGAVLWGCQSAPSTPPPFYQDDILTLTNSDLVRVDRFDGSGFDDPGWSSLSTNPGAGQRPVLLKLPDSDDIRSGWWLLGRSHNPEIVAHCTHPERAGQTLTGTPTMIDGHPFTRFEISDAGMSHYRQVRAWRGVTGGSCLSIEHIVQGVRGDVFDPPRTPAFTIDAAMARLEDVNDALAFDNTP